MKMRSGISKKILLFLFPWRDALGIMIANTPLRFGELFALLMCCSVITVKRRRFDKKEALVLAVLAVNLLVTLVSTLGNIHFIDRPFAVKYILRNTLYIIFVFAVLNSRFTCNGRDIERLMRFFVVLQLIMMFAIFTTGLHLRISQVIGWDVIIETGQYVTIGGIRIPRFMGTASEAGYLAPLVVMPVHYFLSEYICAKSPRSRRGENLFYLFSIYLISIMTFSTAVYVFVAIVTLFVIGRNIGKSRTTKFFFFLLVMVILLIIVACNIPSISSVFKEHYLAKIYAYLGNKHYSNHSANDRLQHLKNAWEMFREGNVWQIIIGHGTGGYYTYARSSSQLLVVEVNEAYNLFLSSLTDRGILGFACLVALFFALKAFALKNHFSETVFVGIVAQYLHWMLTGNFWLYYFWFEVLLLIGLYRQNNRGFSIYADDSEQIIQLSVVFLQYGN